MSMSLETPATAPAAIAADAPDGSRAPPLWCTLGLCAAILWLRRPDAVLNPQFWAEDGPVFFRHAHEHGFAALFLPSAGYLHVLLRLVAWFAVHFDPALAPAIFAGAAALMMLYVAARTQSARCPLPPSVGYALALVLVPDAAEVLLSLTNAQWVLAAGLLLLVISREAETAWQRVHDLAGVVALGLTGPFSIVVAPLAVWRALRRRTRFSVVLAGLAVACAAIQGIVIFRNGGGFAGGRADWNTTLGITGVRIGASLMTGGRVDAHGGLPTASLLGVVTLAGVIALAAWRGPARLERTWLALAFFALLVLALYRCRADLAALLYGAGPRYMFPLQLIVLWLLIATAVAGPVRGAWIARVLLVVSIAFNLPRLRVPALPDLNWPAYAARIRNGESVTVPVNPEGWSFTMPACDHPRVTAQPPVREIPPRLNFSTRGITSRGHPLILAFALADTAPRRFLVRAVGPSLSKFGVPQPLAHPQVALLREGRVESSFVAQRNAQADPALAEAAARCGAFPLEPHADDAVGLATLSAGSFSVVVSPDDDSLDGMVLVEVYELPRS